MIFLFRKTSLGQMVRNFPGNGLVSFPKSVGYKIEQLNGLPLISARANIQNVPVPRGHFFSILYENILFSIFRTVWRTNTKSLEPTVFVSSCKENDDKLTRQLTEFSRSVIGQESLSLRKLSIFRNRKKTGPCPLVFLLFLFGKKFLNVRVASGEDLFL